MTPAEQARKKRISQAVEDLMQIFNPLGTPGRKLDKEMRERLLIGDDDMARDTVRENLARSEILHLVWLLEFARAALEIGMVDVARAAVAFVCGSAWANGLATYAQLVRFCW